MEFNFEDPIFEDDIDVDSILQGFPYEFFDEDRDLDLWLSSNSSPSSEESERPQSHSSFAEEIEKLLMNDDDEEKGAQFENGDKVVMEEFLADALVDGNGSGSSDSGRSEVASPESGGSAESKAAAEEVVTIDEEEREEDEDEQVSKKRRRY